METMNSKVHCGGLKRNDSHRLIYLNASSLKIKRCALVGVAVTLLEEGCHWDWALRFQESKPGHVSSSFYLIWMQNSELPLQHLVWLHTSMIPSIIIMD